MEKIYAPKPNTPAVSQHRFFRRFVRKMFARLIKRQSLDCQDGLQNILEKLQDIGDSIEIMAREIARQAKRGK